MEAGLARLARQPGKRDEFLLCLYEKISSRLPGQFCYIDVVLTVVKNRQIARLRVFIWRNSHPGKRDLASFKRDLGNRASPLVHINAP